MGNDSGDERRGMLIAGFIVTGIGVLFLLVELRIIPRIGEMWPVIPIIVGLALIIGGLRTGRKPERAGEPGRRSTGTGDPETRR